MSKESRQARCCYLDVHAAFNCENLAMPQGPPSTVRSVEELTEYPSLWAGLSELETGNMLMDLYVARRRMQ